MSDRYSYKLTGGMGAPLTIKCEFAGPGLVGFAEPGRPPGHTLRLLPRAGEATEYGTPDYFAAGVTRMLEAAYEAGRQSVGADLRAIIDSINPNRRINP